MVDYSKWKDIEISDDEDDTHPNIDTPSLFRWRHQARVERMEQAQKEREDFEAAKKAHEQKVKAIKEKISKGEIDEKETDKVLAELDAKTKEIQIKDEEFRKKDKKTPWNVDTISKPGFDKSVLNKTPKKRQEENLTEEEKEKRMVKFVKENEKTIKQYGMLRKYDDSKRFLQEHQHLVCDDTANYLVIWCINLEMEKKHDLMHHVAHQCICMQYILELSKQLEVDPRACVNSFFTKIQDAVVEYKQQFDNDIESFIKRIERRAEEKIEEAIAEEEEKERQARLGPGGLDPVEVFETLPDELKKCFESRDIKLLQDAIAKMPEEEAKYHMKRCVDSGLWIPDGGLKNKENSEETGSSDQSDNQGSFKAAETKEEETAAATSEN
uniref:Hsp90 co-chaperone Cdc37 n=1 Tax=Tabanus bromius TaxID=304241 RepID=A0A0K8TM07_TABBR